MAEEYHGVVRLMEADDCVWVQVGEAERALNEIWVRLGRGKRPCDSCTHRLAT